MTTLFDSSSYSSNISSWTTLLGLYLMPSDNLSICLLLVVFLVTTTSSLIYYDYDYISFLTFLCLVFGF